MSKAKKVTEESVAVVTEELKNVEVVEVKPFKASRRVSSGVCVYIGPSVIGLIQNGTIYGCSVEEARIREAIAIEKYPDIADLIIDMNRLNEAREKLNNPVNSLTIKYERVLRGTN